MSCGCNNTDKILIPVTTSCAQAQLDGSPCSSQSGKFHDRSIEDFTVPAVGKIANLHVCQANLWGVGQYVGIVIGKSKYGFFRITEVGERVLKVLNGCEKGNTINNVAGNPEPGEVIPEGAVVFPAPPFGCSEYLKQQFLTLLQSEEGIDGVIKILNESDEICFYSTPELEVDAPIKDTFLFGGTWAGGCLRKIKKIFTGLGGKTICIPETQITDESSVIVNDVLTHKYVAYIDERGCLKKGKLASCVMHNRKTFDIRMETVYDGLSLTVTTAWAALNAPSPTLCDEEGVWAELDVIINIAGSEDASVIRGFVNGEQQNVSHTSGPPVFDSRRILIPVVPGGNLVMLGEVYEGTPPTLSAVKIVLIGFHV